MNQEYLLADTVTETLETQCERAVEHTADNNISDASAILSEWTLANGDCVLTNYLNQTTEDIEERLLYVSFVNDQLFEGEFWFDPEAELPTDNI